MENLSMERKKNPEKEIMEVFYKKITENNEEHFKHISLDQFNELKEKGITTEKFLDYLCQNYGLLLHGSTQEIEGGKLKSRDGKVFASNKAAIAIMRSLYSNVGVNLSYPYNINKSEPLVLKIHTPLDGEHISREKGFVYIIDCEGFQNNPKGS